MDIFNCEKYIGSKSFVDFYLLQIVLGYLSIKVTYNMLEFKRSVNIETVLFECPLPCISSS